VAGGKVVVLTGGIGGAKLVRGMIGAIPAEAVTAIVNTGDDFVHLGLAVSPDIDTLLYTLADKANPILGWGRRDESWNFMAALKSLGGEDWFALGDGDLALHILRTTKMAQGASLTSVTADFARAWDIAARILPMSDERVATELVTDEGLLSFQDYFVARRCRPAVHSIGFKGADSAAATPAVLAAIADPRARAIVIAPSNPYLSIDPILAVPGIREALASASAPVVAVSPLVAGRAVKGPTDKLMSELGLAVNHATIARHYAGLIDAILIDGDVMIDSDGPPDSFEGIVAARTDTLMQTIDDKIRVANAALALADNFGR
jgi:LPPG:FO 2-phospho-L-lactate transferase